MFIAVVAAFGVTLVASQLIERFGTSAAGETDARSASPLALGLASAIVAGICEEFIYRGFLIEELGELLRNRSVAAAISVVVFALAHQSVYGWSVASVYPGLIGLVITILYLRRGSLPICILMHASLDAVYELAQRA